MKIRSVVALQAWTISFALPIFAQEKEAILDGYLFFRLRT
jgi:hypothetical protein